MPSRPPIAPVFQPAGQQPQTKAVQVTCPVCGGTEGRDRHGNVRPHKEWLVGPAGQHQGADDCPGGGQKPEQP